LRKSICSESPPQRGGITTAGPRTRSADLAADVGVEFHPLHRARSRTWPVIEPRLAASVPGTDALKESESRWRSPSNEVSN
jgi:hypothetical protein